LPEAQGMIRAMAIALAEAGADLALPDHNEEGIEATAQDEPVRIFV
jgi:NAD(P)-dependent dehydrogenase (short-subunit alcohol dehydrogenase family)